MFSALALTAADQSALVTAIIALVTALAAWLRMLAGESKRRRRGERPEDRVP